MIHSHAQHRSIKHFEENYQLFYSPIGYFYKIEENLTHGPFTTKMAAKCDFLLSKSIEQTFNSLTQH